MLIDDTLHSLVKACGAMTTTVPLFTWRGQTKEKVPTTNIHKFVPDEELASSVNKDLFKQPAEARLVLTVSNGGHIGWEIGPTAQVNTTTSVKGILF